jgi:hypothetical protein
VRKGLFTETEGWHVNVEYFHILAFQGNYHLVPSIKADKCSLVEYYFHEIGVFGQSKGWKQQLEEVGKNGRIIDNFSGWETPTGTGQWVITLGELGTSPVGLVPGPVTSDQGESRNRWPNHLVRAREMMLGEDGDGMFPKESWQREFLSATNGMPTCAEGAREAIGEQ